MLCKPTMPTPSGVLLAGHGLDHQLVYAVGIFRLDIGQRDALIGHLGAFGHGEDHVVRAGHAAVQLHARPQVLHVRHKHRFRPRYAGIGVQGVDDQRLAPPPKRAGVHAHLFHSEGQLIAFQPLPEQGPRAPLLGRPWKGRWRPGTRCVP